MIISNQSILAASDWLDPFPSDINSRLNRTIQAAFEIPCQINIILVSLTKVSDHSKKSKISRNNFGGAGLGNETPSIDKTFEKGNHYPYTTLEP